MVFFFALKGDKKLQVIKEEEIKEREEELVPLQL